MSSILRLLFVSISLISFDSSNQIPEKILKLTFKLKAETNPKWRIKSWTPNFFKEPLIKINLKINIEFFKPLIYSSYFQILIYQPIVSYKFHSCMLIFLSASFNYHRITFLLHSYTSNKDNLSNLFFLSRFRIWSTVKKCSHPIKHFGTKKWNPNNLQK